MSYLPGTWKQLLPKSYDWLDKVKITGMDGLSGDHWNVIPVEKTEQKTAFLADSLDNSILQALKDGMQSYGWTPQDKPLRLVVNKQSFLLVGKSPLKVSNGQVARQIGFDAASALAKCDRKEVAIPPLKDLQALDVFEGFCLGLEEGGYFKGNANLVLPAEIGLPKDQVAASKTRLAMIKALVFTKWLQDAPANWLDSERVGEIVEEAFRDKAQVEVLGREDMTKIGMGSFLSVAQGSDKDPKLVTLFFEGENKDKTVALVGKGVTFDSGGINLKPSSGMEEMKYDMSGAAAVLGAAQYFAQVKPPVNVVCAVGAVENMPSGNATRPGDIVRSLSGKTIEILNTDAEGRLVLADVLTHVIRTFKPDLTMDIATLTGAVILGLGHAGCAIVTPDDKTSDYLGSVGRQYGEPGWRLPLWPELEGELTSELADIKNIPQPNVKAGTIMGAWFLHEFAKESAGQWAHLDIAGTAWNCTATGYQKVGGSAYGVRTLVGACEKFES
jgi:leucyl aminopeptidase